MKTLNRSEVAQLIANLLDRGIDLEELAEVSGISIPTIIMIMNGQLKPAPMIRTALAEALGIQKALLVDV